MISPSLVAELKSEIIDIKQQSPISAGDIRLMGASKTQPIEIIEQAIAAGLILFGENRVQEAEQKWPLIKERHPNVRVHLIGSLQTNKVKDALMLFDAIQTLDREKLAYTLANEMAKLGKKLDCYIEINTGNEPQKAGIIPEKADTFIDYCISQLQLPVVGLMCVPPSDQPPAPHFALLRKIAMDHGLKELSMGMSGDWQTAVRMGSTCIRLGRALFGERQ